MLQALARSSGPLTAGQLADRTGSTRSLVYRVVAELVERRLVSEVHTAVSSAQQSMAYRLGSGIIELGADYARSVPYMQALRQNLVQLAVEFGETASVGTRDGDKVLYLMREEGVRSVFSVSQVGKCLPANATGSGKALLAELTDGEVRALYSQPNRELRALTDQSLSTITDLLRNLKETRIRGYAVESGETVPGRCCVAVAIPVADPTLEKLALSVSTDARHFEQIKVALIERLLEIKHDQASEVQSRQLLGDSYRADTMTARISAGYNKL